MFDLETIRYFALLPLVLISALAIVVYMRIGIAWCLYLILQSLILLAISTIGMLQSDFQKAEYCTVFGWLMFFLVIVSPRSIYGKFQKAISALQPDQAVRYANQLGWFYWGQPGMFYKDLAQALAEYMRNRKEQGDAILAKWQNASIPKEIRSTLISYQLMGKLLIRDYQSIVELYAQYQDLSRKQLRYDIALGAARAYAELGNIPEALNCVRQSDLGTRRLSKEDLATSLIALFALSGNNMALEEAIADIKSSANLPQCSYNYWRGRCQMRLGNITEAFNMLEKSLNEVPGETSNWRERIELQLEECRRLERNKNSTANSTIQVDSQAANELGIFYNKLKEQANIVTPKGSTPATTFLLVLITIIFIASQMSFLLMFLGISNAFFLNMSKFLYTKLLLSTNVFQSHEYYRAFTYMFLHSNILHFSFNALALYYFGRPCERIFGVAKFIYIFLSTGIISGFIFLFFAQYGITVGFLSGPHSSMQAIVGASGAIMGLFGASISGIYCLRNRFNKQMSKSLLTNLIAIAILQIVIDQFVPRIAFVAHLSGLVFGLIIGYLIKPSYPHAEQLEKSSK